MKKDNEFKELPNKIYKYSFERKNKKLFILQILSLILCVFLVLILISGLVWKKDIASYTSPYFNSARESVNCAVKNGYIQNLKSEFVYDNNVGVRVDNIVLDDYNLNIMYEYNYNSNIEEVYLQEYEIIDNNDNIIYNQSDTYSKLNCETLTNYFRKVMGMESKENIGVESILYTSEKYPIIEKMYIHISKININSEQITGNWNLEVDIDSQFNKREVIEYKLDNTENVLDYKITMSETSLRIYIKMDDVCDNGIFGRDRIVLEDSNGKKCRCHNYSVQKLENASICYLDFDLGKYNENIEEMFLKIIVNGNTRVQTKLTSK